MISLPNKKRFSSFQLLCFRASNGFTDGFQFIRSVLSYVVIASAVFFTCTIVYATGNRQASDILTLMPDQNLYELNQNIEILQDATKELTIQEVSSESMSIRFTPVHSKNINLGLSESAFWFRFSIKKSAGVGQTKSWLLNIGRCFLTRCELFFSTHSSDQSEGRSQWQMLDANQFEEKQKSIVCSPIVFPLPLLKTQPTVFYLRIHSPEGGLYFSFKIGTEKAINDSLEEKTLWFGIYYGTLLAMLFFNLYLYISLRETVQLYYILYIVSVILYFIFINGIFAEYFSDKILHDRLNIFVVGLTIFWATGFGKYFLDTKKYAGYIDKILAAIMTASVGLLLVTPFATLLFLNQATSLLGMASPVSMIIAAIICWRKGFRPIFFFLLAWSILCVSGIIYALTYRGTLPYLVLTFYSFQIGSCLEVVILSFAMGERLRNLRRERDSIRRMFGKYVSNEICDEILSGKIPLDGEVKEVTVLISDLRDYTPLVESTPPKDLVKITNMYLEAMAKIIEQNRGVILRFVGDSIQAVFGAPLPLKDHPALAVKTALDMRTELISVNDRLEKSGFKKLRHGIGIHTGNVTVANIGSPERLSYSLSGITVNVASRLENLNKKFNTDILISKTTMSFIKDDLHVKSLGPVVLRGLSEPLEVLKVL